MRSPNAIEYRYAADLRLADDGRTLEGVLVSYGDTAAIGTYRERIRAGAFSPVPANIRLNRQHNREAAFAMAGLTDSASTLALRAVVPSTRVGDDVLTLIREGVLGGLSIEMRVTRDEWAGMNRTITAANVVGAAVVDVPAYAASVVATRAASRERALDAAIGTKRRPLWL